MLLMLLAGASLHTEAQPDIIIHGVIYIKAQYPQSLPGASISLTGPNGVHRMTQSDEKGRFSLQVPQQTTLREPLLLVCTHVGFRKFELPIPPAMLHALQDSTLFIYLREAADSTLQQVQVQPRLQRPQIKGDTLIFRRQDYEDPDTRKLKDLLAAMPGFEVSESGAVRFNGKEISRVLIDGQQISTADYKQLVKGLSSKSFSEVQLIQRYGEDRLLKTILEGDELALNLKVEHNPGFRPSGSLNMGANPQGWYGLDLDALLVHPTIKGTAFAEANNVGEPPGASSAIGSVTNLTGFTEKTTHADLPQSFPTTSFLQTPSLRTSYWNRNCDASFQGSAAGRVARHTHLLGGWQQVRQQLQLENSELATYQPGAQESWNTATRSSQLAGLNNTQADIKISHDQLKNNQGNWSIRLARSEFNNTLENRTSGAITDSLQEQNRFVAHYFSVSGSETFKTGTRQVMKLTASLHWLHKNDDLGIITSRLNGYFHLPDSFTLHMRSHTMQDRLLNFRWQYFIRSGKVIHSLAAFTHWNGGTFFNAAQASAGVATSSPPVNTIHNAGNYQRMETGLSHASVIRPGKAFQWNTEIRLAMHQLNIQEASSRSHYGFPAGQLAIGGTVGKKPFRKWSFEVKYNRNLAPTTQLLPMTSLSGGPSLRDNPVAPRVTEDLGCSITYSRISFAKGIVLLATASFTKTMHVLSDSTSLVPEYVYARAVYLPSAHQGSVSFRFEKSLPKFNSRMVFQTNLNSRFLPAVVNGTFTQQQLSVISHRLEPVVKAGKQFKASLMLVYTGWFSNTINDTVIHRFNHQLSAGGTFNYALQNRWIVGLRYYLSGFGTSIPIHQMDGSLTYKAGKRCSLSVSGQNILGETAVVLRHISVTNITESRLTILPRIVQARISIEL